MFNRPLHDLMVLKHNKHIIRKAILLSIVVIDMHRTWSPKKINVKEKFKNLKLNGCNCITMDCLLIILKSQGH